MLVGLVVPPDIPEELRSGVTYNVLAFMAHGGRLTARLIYSRDQFRTCVETSVFGDLETRFLGHFPWRRVPRSSSLPVVEIHSDAAAYLYMRMTEAQIPPMRFPPSASAPAFLFACIGVSTVRPKRYAVFCAAIVDAYGEFCLHMLHDRVTLRVFLEELRNLHLIGELYLQRGMDLARREPDFPERSPCSSVEIRGAVALHFFHILQTRSSVEEEWTSPAPPP